MKSISEQILNRDFVLSYSSLKAFRKSPEHFIQYKTTPRIDTEATLFGNAFHCWVLRNSDFMNEFIIFDDSKRPEPGKDYRTKVNQEWKARFIEENEASGKKIIKVDQFEQIKVMNDKILLSDPARELIEYTRSKFEEQIFFERKKLKMISYIDINADIFMADIKTCQDAEPRLFQRDLFYNGYDFQAAVYNDAVSKGHAKFGQLKEFYFIAIEKSAPYGVSVHKMNEETLNFAFSEYLETLDRFNECLDDPGLFERSYDYYSKDQTNKIFDVSLPFWKTAL